MATLVWKGYTWNLADRAAADPFVNSFAADHVTVDGSGYVHLAITNSGGVSVGAEMSSTTEGLGYGTYTCVVGSRVDNLHPNVVFGGMFTYGASAGYGHREIDACEQSMWSGATGPCTLGHVHWQSSVPGDPSGPRGGYDAADVTTLSDTTQTTVMVWEPGRITYRTYHGTTITPGNLFRESVVQNGQTITFNVEGGGPVTVPAVVPVPGDERIHFNLWVCPNYSGTSDPATVTTTDVIIRDFTFVPLVVTPPSPTTAVVGLNITGAEHTDATDSNLPGTYVTDYEYEPAATFTYLNGEGVKDYRLPVRWKRLQPTVLTALDATELGRLTTEMSAAATAGAKRLIVEVHDFGRRDGDFAGLPIGAAGGPTLLEYTDFQGKLAVAVQAWAVANPTVRVEIEHTNEPHDMAPVVGTFTPTTTRYDFETAVAPAGFGADPFGSAPFGEG